MPGIRPMMKRRTGIRDEASRSPSLVTGYNGTAPLYTTAGNKPMTVYDTVSLSFSEDFPVCKAPVIRKPYYLLILAMCFLLIKE